MARIRLPINIVVIHGPNHVAIQKCRIDRIGLEPGDECSRATVAAVPATGHSPVMPQQDLCIILLAAAKRTANGVEPK